MASTFKNPKMNTWELLRFEMSVIVLEPKAPFLEWLLCVTKDKYRSQENLYSPEDSLVIAIPRIEKFPSETDFWLWVDAMKPQILAFVLNSYGIQLESLPNGKREETFNEFFDIELKHDLVHYSRINKVQMPKFG